MLSVEEAICILDELFKREIGACYDERCLGSDELVAIQVLYDYVKHLEEMAENGGR